MTGDEDYLLEVENSYQQAPEQSLGGFGSKPKIRVKQNASKLCAPSRLVRIYRLFRQLV
jgi:hypothetical protein